VRERRREAVSINNRNISDDDGDHDLMPTRRSRTPQF
jgi:hypothetical protein